MSHLALDIGGTKIRLCMFEAGSREPHDVRTVRTAQLRRGTVAFVDDLVELVRAQAYPGLDRLGVVLNGVLSGHRVLYSSVLGGPQDLDIAAYMGARLGVPAVADDDIHAMARAEQVYGGHDPGATLAVLNLGTGIGVGIVEGGRVLRGAFGAGLISEIPVHSDVLDRWATLDTLVCGRGLCEVYEELSGKRIEGRAVFAAAERGDAAAATTVRAFCSGLEWVLQAVSRFAHPHKILLTGSVTGAWGHIGPRVLAGYRSDVEPLFQAETVGPSRVGWPAELGVLSEPTDDAHRYGGHT